MSLPSQAHRFLKIDTKLGKDTLIVSRASGVETLGRMYEIQVEFTSASDDLDVEGLLGTAVLIRLEKAGALNRAASVNTRYFSGFFSRITYCGFQREGRPVFRATVVPWLWFLTRTSDCRIFQNKSVRDIIEKVLSDAGSADSGFFSYEFVLAGSYPTIEYCVQYRETDFQFISRLMEREGMYYYFLHTKDGHKMVICDEMGSHEPEEGFERLAFIGGAASGASPGVITDLEFTSEIKSGAYAHNDFNFLTPTPDPNLRLLSRSSAPNPQEPYPYEIYDAPGGFLDQSEGSRYARLRMEEIQADRNTVTGRTNIQGLRAGRKFELLRHPTKKVNRGYLITSVQWAVQEGSYASGGGSGGEFFSCGFSCIPDDGVFRSARLTPVPRIDGPQTAIVVGPPGDEIHVDQHGRVKVQFPWDREGNCDSQSSCWIRVSQPWAGSGFGGIAVPRIGHEVIVEFIEGDPDRPIITGKVYNGWAKPPYELPANATRTTLKTNTSPGSGGFNEVRFEDKKGEEQIFVRGQKNLDVRIRNRIRETSFGERHEKVGKNLFVTVEKESNTHILETHYEMTKDQHQTVDGELTTKVVKSSKNFVGETHLLNAADLIIETSKSVSIKTAKFTLQGAMGVHVLGQQIILEGTSICLKSGGSFITISPAGVSIKGPMVMINSGGCATSAEKPAEKPPIVVMEPLDASPAPDANPGKMGGSGRGMAKARARGGGPVNLHDAPAYTPPPSDPGPMVCEPGPVNKVETVICGGPYILKDKEGRKGNALVIEVVPGSVMGGDTVTVSSEKGCSCAGAKVNVGGVTTALNAPSKVSGWQIGGDPFSLLVDLGKVSPRSVQLSLTCARDGSSISSGEVLVYPCDKIEIKAELKEICKKCPAIDGVFRGIANMLSHLTQMPIDPYKGFSFNQGLGRVNIGAPELSLGYEAQWKEYSVGKPNEWKAYYAWKAGVGAGLSVEYKLDLLAVGLAATGVGAGVVVLFNKIKDAIGQKDPLIFIGLKAEVSVSGSIGYEEKAFGALEGKGTGTLSIGAGIDTDVVEANCNAATSISSSVEGRASSTGLMVSYELLKWSGVTGKAAVKIKVGKLISVGFERSVVLIEGAGPLDKGSIGS